MTNKTNEITENIEQIEIKDLTIDEIIDHCERKLNAEPKDSMLYAEHYHTRKYLLELQDFRDKQQFNVGDLVWCVYDYEEDGESKYDCDGYIFMGVCGDYVLVATEYAHCEDNFNRQLAEMCDESLANQGIDIEMFRRYRVFKTKEEAEIVVGEMNNR